MALNAPNHDTAMQPTATLELQRAEIQRQARELMAKYLSEKEVFTIITPMARMHERLDKNLDDKTFKSESSFRLYVFPQMFPNKDGAEPTLMEAETVLMFEGRGQTTNWQTAEFIKRYYGYEVEASHPNAGVTAADFADLKAEDK